jgi:methyl-accepting chemotaxis protein
MRLGRALSWSAVLLASASGAAPFLGLAGAIPASLALLAAVAAAAAALVSAREESRAAAAEAARMRESRALVPPSGSHAAAPAIASREAAEKELRAKADAEAKAAAARSKAASALRRLRFADSILTKVPVKTEEAAFALMERLIALRDQSAKAGNAAASAEAGSADTDAVAALAKGARDTINRVRTALSEMRSHDRDAAKGLQALGAELRSGIELLAGIEEITERSRLIAFNMAIEAARIGEKGRGFKVIVGELRALNDRTAEFSKRVSELLGRFKKYNESLVETSISSSALVAEEVERGIGEEEKAIESLLSASTACVDLSDDVSRVVRAMNVELDGILESLQFQDITRQMVEGALKTIAEAEGDMAPLGSGDGSAAAREEERRRVEELRAALLARAKTKGEKEAIQEVRR